MATNFYNSMPSAVEALARLKAGNERFQLGQAHCAGLTRETITDLAKGQRPFATILGCSDSRVPPEWVFDAGLGELFVLRVAGNILSPEVAGSLEYAGAHLQTPLFVVLGHEGCGAVSAALEVKFKGAQHGARIQVLVDGIVPALQDLDPRVSAEELQRLAVEANVRRTVERVLNSPEGKSRLAEGMMMVGAVYEIQTGRVRFLST